MLWFLKPQMNVPLLDFGIVSSTRPPKQKLERHGVVHPVPLVAPLSKWQYPGYTYSVQEGPNVGLKWGALNWDFPIFDLTLNQLGLGLDFGFGI